MKRAKFVTFTILLSGVAAIAFLTLSATRASAQSLSVKDRMAKEEADLQKAASSPNKRCGTKITVRFDWTSAPLDDLPKYSSSGYCEGGPLDAIWGICNKDGDPQYNADGELTAASSKFKQKIKDQIKTVICGFGPKRTISLKDGVLDYKINFHSYNDLDFARDYLEDALGVYRPDDTNNSHNSQK
jgi:hypothetical protein